MGKNKKLKVKSEKSKVKKQKAKAVSGKARTAAVERNTKETKISIMVNLDGTGQAKVKTGVGFFDHMLELMAKRALFDLEVKAKGDLHIDLHHTVEDIGIVLGQAVKQALGSKAGIARYAYIQLPMDEALAEAAIDISGRPYLVYEQPVLSDTRVGEFDIYLLKEFFEGFVNNAAITLHLKQLKGNNAHHVLEAMFKAFGQVLGMACRIDPRQSDVPSTKGVL